MLTLLIVFCGSLPLAHAQKKDEKKKKEEPKITLIHPLGAVPGQKAKLTIRGLHLDKAKAVVFPGTDIKAKILKKEKAPVPDNNPEQAGDTQIIIEATLPKDLAAEPLAVEVETDKGKTKPHQLLIERKLPVIAEKEPNEGFPSAQEVQIPAIVDGSIQRRQDVDVYAFTAKKGQRVRIEVLARRHGSLLDSMLTLYNEKGQQIAFGEYVSDSTDARIEATLPGDGRYFVTLIDALDRGGPTHPYWLVFRLVE